MPFSLGLALRVLAVWTLIPAISICQVAQPSHPLDRHARKIQKTLVSFPPRSNILVVLQDNSRHPGIMVDLSDSSFDMVSYGQWFTASYADVKRVQRADRNTGMAVASHKAGTVVLTVLAVSVGIGAAYLILGFLYGRSGTD